jgi:hypothetical protein
MEAPNDNGEYFSIERNDEGIFVIVDHQKTYTRESAINAIQDCHKTIHAKQDAGGNRNWNAEIDPVPMFATKKELEEKLNNKEGQRPPNMPFGGRTLNDTGELNRCKFATYMHEYCNGLCGSDGHLTVVY